MHFVDTFTQQMLHSEQKNNDLAKMVLINKTVTTNKQFSTH